MTTWRWGLTVAVVVAIPLSAVAAPAPGDAIAVASVAWTSDSGFALVKARVVFASSVESENQDLDGPPCDCLVATVYDAHTGTQTRYLADARAADGSQPPSCKKPMQQLHLEHDSPALQAWEKAHAASPVKWSPKSADGAASASLATGSSSRDSGSLSVSKSSDDDDVGYLLRVRRAGRAFNLGGGTLGCQMGGFVKDETYWSPNGKALIWTQFANCGGGGVPITKVSLASLDAARIAVAFDSKATADRRSAVRATLSAVGVPILRWEDAKDSHAATVVYAAQGFEEAGKKVAAALPGAKVDALNWKSDDDLVVAVAP